MRTTTKSTPPAVRRLMVLGLAGALGAAAGLGVMPAASAATATTDAVISNFSFTPDPVTIPVGGTVKWTNDDNATHTVTADDGSFDSGFKSLHGTFTQTFNQAGRFAYHCNVHAGMHGTVEVGSATTPTTAPPATTTTTAAPTTTTTVRATTTTVPPTTQPPATTDGGPAGTTPRAPVPAKAAAPKAAPKPPAGPPTGAATASAPIAAPSPTTFSDDVPASPETTPPSEVAAGVTTPRSGDGGGRGGPAVGLAAAVLLGAAAFVVAGIRRRSQNGRS